MPLYKKRAKGTETELVQAFIRKELKAKLRQYCEKNRLSISETIDNAIEKYLRERGEI